ncbi:MAG: enoyl-CoA hydratase/isomerase family protein, partial [Lautropia sp.]
GAGLSLVESTDLAVATDDAVLGHPEQRGNLAGAAYLTSWLMLTLGARKAREMLLLANSVSGAEAARIGLVNCAVAPGELESVGEAWAERVVGLPRDAIAVGKAATHLALDSLGMTSQFVHGYLTHTLSTHVHREADEIDTVPARFISRRNVR